MKGGTKTTIDTDIESKLIFGRARAYGTELNFKKSSGDLKGSLSYSLSHAFQQFDSLNNSLEFTSANNRKNNFYVSASYDINTYWTFSANLLLPADTPLHYMQNLPLPCSHG